ncbi:MAG: hypothetical protein RR314_04200 [Oscillospiraceae bacterium]
MVTRKYIRDYKLSESVSPGGRIITESVYVGGDYYLTAPTDTQKTTKALLVCLTALSWLVFIIALLPMSRASHIFYIALPHAFSALPLALATRAVIYLHSPQPYTRERSEKIAQGLPSGSAFCAGLSGAALVGLIVTAVLTPEAMTSGDVVFGVCSALLTAASAICFSKRRLLACKKRD